MTQVVWIDRRKVSWNLFPFRLEVKSSLPEGGGMAGALEKLRERDAAGES